MKLAYYNDSSNVGDQLNDYIWKKEFNSLLESSEDKTNLIAIGSILHESFPLYEGRKKDTEN